jgi:hypothetical protein
VLINQSPGAKWPSRQAAHSTDYTAGVGLRSGEAMLSLPLCLYDKVLNSDSLYITPPANNVYKHFPSSTRSPLSNKPNFYQKYQFLSNMKEELQMKIEHIMHFFLY